MKHVRTLLLLLLPYLVFLTLTSSTKQVEYIEVECVEYVYIDEKPQYEILATRPEGFPIDSNHIRKTSTFGMRLHPIYKIWRMHSGIDFACDYGTKVVSTGYGIVEKIECKPDGYGINITISHAQYKTRYAHLGSVSVKVGEYIKRGDIIGLVGSSGTSTGPHLHYEVMENNSQKNPTEYL